jgi:cell division protein FtsL
MDDMDQYIWDGSDPAVTSGRRSRRATGNVLRQEKAVRADDDLGGYEEDKNEYDAYADGYEEIKEAGGTKDTSAAGKGGNGLKRGNELNGANGLKEGSELNGANELKEGSELKGANELKGGNGVKEAGGAKGGNGKKEAGGEQGAGALKGVREIKDAGEEKGANGEKGTAGKKEAESAMGAGLAGLRALLSYRWIMKNVSFFLFLAALAVVYIYNGHYADKIVRDINKTNKEVKELQYEYKTLKSEVMFRSKQSELAKAVEPFGLKELTQPPVVLVDSTKP